MQVFDSFNTVCEFVGVIVLMIDLVERTEGPNQERKADCGYDGLQAHDLAKGALLTGQQCTVEVKCILPLLTRHFAHHIEVFSQLDRNGQHHENLLDSDANFDDGREEREKDVELL